MKENSILLKISGEFLTTPDSGVINLKNIKTICQNLAKHFQANKKHHIGIVFGAGNIWRGETYKDFFSDSIGKKDYIGMIATVINGGVFAECLNHLNISNKIFSPIPYDKHLVHKFSKRAARAAQQKFQVSIFVGGTGTPFKTTDSAASLVAMTLNYKKIIVYKNNTDGLYTSDPNKNKNAKFIKEISKKEYLDKKYKIMDTNAIQMLKNSDTEIEIIGANHLIDTDKLFKQNIKKTLIR